jgi:hypothetical protein
VVEGIAETRWIVLATDRRHATLARHSDPDQDEISKAENALRTQNLGGWLVLMKGAYYVCTKPQLMLVRPLGEPLASWERAVAEFETRWQEAIRLARSVAIKPPARELDNGTAPEPR